MGRGVISASLFRSEQIQIEQRTSDPSDPDPEEQWLRVDIKPEYEDADGNTQTGVAEYRIQNADGSVDAAPVAQVGHTTDEDVVDKVRLEVDAGGSPTGTGFVPFSLDGAAYGGRRLEHPTEGQIRMHDSLVANAIPDSVVTQYYATTWSQGDGTWSDDQGNANMSVNGDQQDGTLSDGSESVHFDGADDYGTVAIPSDLEGTNLESHTIEFATQWSHNNTGYIMGVTDGSLIIGIQANAGVDGGSLTSSDGDFVVRLRDGDFNSWDFGTFGEGLNDSSRHNVSIIINDSTQNDATVIIDGNEVTISQSSADPQSAWGSFSEDIAIAADNSNGSLGDYFEVGIGAIRWHNESIIEQTINNYPE